MCVCVCNAICMYINDLCMYMPICVDVYLFSNQKWPCPAGSRYLIMKVVLPYTYLNVYFFLFSLRTSFVFPGRNTAFQNCK